MEEKRRKNKGLSKETGELNIAFTLRLTAPTKMWAENRAKAQGISLAAYIENLILNAREKTVVHSA